MLTEVWPILSPLSMNMSFQMRPSLWVSAHRQIKPIERRESTELHLVPRRFAQGKAGSLYNLILVTHKALAFADCIHPSLSQSAFGF